MYQAVILPHFKRELKQYIKKHRSLKDDVVFVIDNFKKQNAINVGGGVYKVRLKSQSLNKGKSKSFRLIMLVVEIDKIIVPITIFFKGDSENISKKEINEHLEVILFELKAGDLLLK